MFSVRNVTEKIRASRMGRAPVTLVSALHKVLNDDACGCDDTLRHPIFIKILNDGARSLSAQRNAAGTVGNNGAGFLYVGRGFAGGTRIRRRLWLLATSIADKQGHAGKIAFVRSLE